MLQHQLTIPIIDLLKTQVGIVFANVIRHYLLQNKKEKNIVCLTTDLVQ
jgi:hypothetical protein